MTYFTPAIDKYLAYWILQDTWYTPQDIEDNFYRFVIAIDHFSKSYTTRMRRLKGVSERHNRTCNKKTFIEKVLLAIKRNHENFDEQYATKLVTKLADKAMIILDALWFSRMAGFPRSDIQGSNLMLK